MATKKDVHPADLELTDDGLPIASVLFGFAFYADVSFSRIGPATLKIFDVFQSFCPKGTLNFYITDTMNKHKRVDERSLGMLPLWLRPGAPKRDAIVISYQSSEAFNAAPRCCFMVNGAEDPAGKHTDEASVIRIGFPATFGVDRADEMAEVFETMCGLAPFRAARAGFSFICSRYGDWEQAATEHAWAKSMRHPGLDIIDMVNEVLTVGPDAIMGVDWLTYIDSAFVKQLGGADALKKSLLQQDKTKKVGSSRPSGGLMLRAGERPRIGDLNRGDDLPEYKAVYRLLRPLMEVAFDRARSLSLEDDEEDRTLEWLKRHER